MRQRTSSVLARATAPEFVAVRGTPVGLPLYRRIAHSLAGMIHSGELLAQAQLPTEARLAEEWRAARMTVRHALALLEQEGLIYRRHGVGTFVSEPKLVQNATLLRGFFEQALGQGLFPQSTIVRKGERSADAHLSGYMKVAPGSTNLEVVRLRSARGVPVVVEHSYFPAGTFPGLLAHDLEHRSIYRLMDEEYSGRPTSATQTIEIAEADAENGRLLGVALHTPLMRVERVAHGPAGDIREYAEDFYRGDQVRFVTNLKL